MEQKEQHIVCLSAERIRTKYLLPHIEWLMQKQSEMEENAASLSDRKSTRLNSSH